MSADRDRQLLELAESIGDGVPVDWESAGARDPELTATLARLRRVEALATALRAAREEEGEPTPTTRPPLFRWGHLEVREKLGEGSFAEVYRAFDPRLEREVALKLRRPSPTPSAADDRLFVAEARRLARVRHPNVLEVYGADLCDGRVGLWTELVSGAPLDRWLRQEGPLDPHEALQIGLQLCRALAAVHGAGLVHGDVKAANVIREQGGRIVLADFGSGSEAGHCSPGDPLFASPLTAAPEVLEGAPPSPAADLYSLGALLFRLLTGRHPVEAEDLEKLRASHARRPAPLVRDLCPACPEPVVRLVEKALAPDRQDRFASAGEMERALEAALTAPPATAGPGGPEAQRRVAPLVALALLTAAAAGLLLLRPWSGPAPVRPAAPAAKARPVSPRPIAVGATLMRARGGRVEPIAAGAAVAPGDHLSLDVSTAEPIHLWVVDGDQEGNAFVLFPLSGVEPGNPLPAGRHRLPGRRDGVPQDWTVTSSGGRETLLLVASREPLPELETELARLAAAHVGAQPAVRGIGGLEPAPLPVGGDAVERIAGFAGSLATPAHPLWVRRLELSNPR